MAATSAVPADFKATPAASGAPRLAPLRFADLAGFGEDDHLEAFDLFLRHAAAHLRGAPPLRPAVSESAGLRMVFEQALDAKPRTRLEAQAFFEAHFAPFRVCTNDATGDAGFFTGYYEPEIAGSLVATPAFSAPILARPDDLVTLAAGETIAGLDPTLTAARRLPDGRLVPYADRAAILAGALQERVKPLIFLADAVEVFIAQVQGSARVRLADGRLMRLTYAGRNGHPYASIGRILIETGEIAEDAMGLAAIKAWIRAHGQGPGSAGAALMARNKSYVFFAENGELAADAGPIGGAGLSLVALRAIAIDRHIWSYGLPIWLTAELPWQSAEKSALRRLMIASDTGSAILGPARADIFFGSGETAGERAGRIRHHGDFVVLLPRTDAGN